jgi:hypothetical protein
LEHVLLQPKFEKEIGVFTISNKNLSELDAFDVYWSEDLYEIWSKSTADARGYLDGSHFHKNCQECFLGTKIALIANKREDARLSFSKDSTDSWMGITKFYKINASTVIEPDDMLAALNKNLRKFWQAGNHITLDEVIAPTKIEHPCVQKVPDKPHDFGIWTVIAGEETVSGRTLVTYINMRTVNNFHLSTAKIIDEMLAGFTANRVVPVQVHHCTDIFYDNKQTRAVIQARNVDYTLASKSSDSDYPWVAIHEMLHQVGDWKAYQHISTKEIISSTMYGTICKNVISNHFKVMQGSHEKSSPLSDYYYSTYNNIDLFNRNFYAVWFKHAHTTIHEVYFDTILSICLVNAWVLFINTTNKDIKLNNFINNVAIQLLHRAGFSKKSKHFSHQK